MNHVAHALVTLGYVGHLPRAPGTWGSAAALVPGALILATFGPWVLLAATLVVLLAGAWAMGRYERMTGRHDPEEGVIDECAGLWLALVPGGTLLPDFLLAFVMFRVFDIVKPWPCRQLDRAGIAGWGGMLDDLAAGAYAAATTFVLKRFTDAWFLGG